MAKTDALAAVAAHYQATAVIPHCAVCRAPCCQLDKLVLDLEWRQVRVLWRIEEARAAFDARLDAGCGPQEIRRAEGRYYAHQKPCPAYDATRPGCRIYDQALKPVGCSDFPVYEDGGVVIADLRCEAVHADTLRQSLQQALGPQVLVRQSADPDFPFLLEFSFKRRTKARRR
ncbi:hypothetical protein [Azonexus sp.]|uniref:hypothetical protein n=1 Tax=Azonexus sp. TaxID=1872668 RepID=UPI0039E2E286